MEFLRFIIVVLVLSCVYTPAHASTYHPEGLHVKSVLEGGKNQLAFPVSHIDALSSPLRHPAADAKEIDDGVAMKNSIGIGRAFTERLQSASKRSTHEDLEVGMVSMGHVAGEVFVPVEIGTPGHKALLILDTGSEISWVQCAPCDGCAETVLPVYDPERSSTFYQLPCTSPLCTGSVGFKGGYCTNNTQTCSFYTGYGDGSLNEGDISVDSFALTSTTGRMAKKSIMFGCSHVDVEKPEGSGASGLMGLKGPYSFTSQFGSSYSYRFSYCLPHRVHENNDAGVLLFGKSRMSRHLRYTPLVSKFAVVQTSYFYVELLGISVDNERLKISEEIFQINSTGFGGTIMDVGTSVTHLLDPALKALREAFAKKFRQIESGVQPLGLSPCYNISSESSEYPATPKITLHFAGGVDMEVDKSNVLIPVGGDQNATTICLAFLSSSGGVNIIGNYQQQNHWIEYDVHNQRIGIAKAKCASR